MWRKVLIGAVAIPVMIASWSSFASRSVAEVRFFDIGQGDAAMISEGRTQMLIDAGPDRSVLNGIGEAMPFMDHRIEYVVLSHPHGDHYRGLVDVLKRYEVTALIVGVPGEEAEYGALMELAKSRKVRIVRAGSQTIRVGSHATFQVLYPDVPLPEEPVENPNNASVVGMATIGKTKILFTGDAELEEERKLMQSPADLDADILKVGHHGSRTSSNPALLETVTPKDSIISLGKNNRYGHPTPMTIQNLTNVKTRIYRTDERGTVTVHINPSSYFISTER